MSGNDKLCAKSHWHDEIGEKSPNLMPPIEDEAGRFFRQEKLYRDNKGMRAWYNGLYGLNLLQCIDFILGTNYHAIARRPDELDGGDAADKENPAQENPAQENLYLLLLHKPDGAERYLEKFNHSKEVIRVYTMLVRAVRLGVLKDLRSKEQKEDGHGQPVVDLDAVIDWIRKHQQSLPIAPDARLEGGDGTLDCDVVADGDDLIISIPIGNAIIRAIQKGHFLSEGQRKVIEVSALARVVQAATMPMRPGELLEHKEIEKCLNTLGNSRSKSIFKKWLRQVALCDKSGELRADYGDSKKE